MIESLYIAVLYPPDFYLPSVHGNVILIYALFFFFFFFSPFFSSFFGFIFILLFIPFSLYVSSIYLLIIINKNKIFFFRVEFYLRASVIVSHGVT